MTERIKMDAERINEITGRPMADCIETATQIAECVRQMKDRVVEFFFMKKDGSVRQAFGTLQDEVILPLIKDTSNREPNPEVVTYFDTVKRQFRSFRKENFKSFVVV